MSKPVYVRCPRCELNYIVKGEKLCSVCKKELRAKGELNDDLDLELCPVCHTNLIGPDEEMCESCRLELGDSLIDDEEEREWRKYIGEEEDIDTEKDEIGDNASIIDIDDENDDFDDDVDDLNFEDSDIDEVDEDFDDENEEEDDSRRK